MPAQRVSTIVGPIRTPEGHLAYPYLLVPETTGQYPANKYVTQFLIKRTEPLTDLVAACLKAAQQEWPDLAITAPNQIKLPFRKGTEKPGWDEFLFFKAKHKNKPQIVDAAKNPWTGTPKGGDVCRLAVSALPYKQQVDPEVAAALQAQGKLVRTGVIDGRSVSWRPAVSFLLNGVQWLREHPPIGGGGGVDGVGMFQAEAAVTPASVAAEDALFT